MQFLVVLDDLVITISQRTEIDQKMYFSNLRETYMKIHIIHRKSISPVFYNLQILNLNKQWSCEVKIFKQTRETNPSRKFQTHHKKIGFKYDILIGFLNGLIGFQLLSDVRLGLILIKLWKCILYSMYLRALVQAMSEMKLWCLYTHSQDNSLLPFNNSLKGLWITSKPFKWIKRINVFFRRATAIFCAGPVVRADRRWGAALCPAVRLWPGGESPAVSRERRGGLTGQNMEIIGR